MLLVAPLFRTVIDSPLFCRARHLVCFYPISCRKIIRVSLSLRAVSVTIPAATVIATFAIIVVIVVVALIIALVVVAVDDRPLSSPVIAPKTMAKIKQHNGHSCGTTSSSSSIDERDSQLFHGDELLLLLLWAPCVSAKKYR
jgi:hypothetical protein